VDYPSELSKQRNSFHPAVKHHESHQAQTVKLSDSEPKTEMQPPPKKRKVSQYWVADLHLKTSDKAIIE